MRSIITNGFPKSGNHALVKACELLGVNAQVQHMKFKTEHLREAKDHILIRRDPRNVIVSKLRSEAKPLTPGMFLACFRAFDEVGRTASKMGIPQRPVIELMSGFEPWLSRAGMVVSYEALIANDQEMRRLARFVDESYEEGLWEQLPGLTYTWNDLHSDYHSIWIPRVQEVWAAEGGNELLKRWGYEV